MSGLFSVQGTAGRLGFLPISCPRRSEHAPLGLLGGTREKGRRETDVMVCDLRRAVPGLRLDHVAGIHSRRKVRAVWRWLCQGRKLSRMPALAIAGRMCSRTNLAGSSGVPRRGCPKTRSLSSVNRLDAYCSSTAARAAGPSSSVRRECRVFGVVNLPRTRARSTRTVPPSLPELCLSGSVTPSLVRARSLPIGGSRLTLMGSMCRAGVAG